MIAPHFAKFITRQHKPYHEDFYLLMIKLCEAVDAGSSCLDLSSVSPHNPIQWREILQPDREDSAVASPGGHSPLILTADGQLYLQRYYLHEYAIFKNIDQRVSQPGSKISASIQKKVEQLFPVQDSSDQAQAALTALKHPFSIISGGPGTGKTTTVLNILLLLRDLGIFTAPEECLLLAPTGKAADRLRQSILEGIARMGYLDIDLPTTASTIHRSLGFRPGKIDFRHTAENPLRAKVVVIDESSMIDLPLMSRLLDAIPMDCRIIMLGDKHQLASVQVGTVLSDLMAAATQGKHPISQCSVSLRKSFRTQGPVNLACEQIRSGDARATWHTLTSSRTDISGATVVQALPQRLTTALAPFVEKHWLPILTDSSLSLEEKLKGIDQFRILSPMHHGPYGVENLNAAVEELLGSHGIPTHHHWYTGRSLIVQSNDHHLGIFNGDTGLCHPDDTGQDAVYFAQANGTRSIATSRLPEVKTAWALTIHRTQGSEYRHILVVIPESDDSPILSRELLYTGLSRAKQSATLWCTEQSLRNTIAQTVQRASGLAEMFTPNSH